MEQPNEIRVHQSGWAKLAAFVAFVHHLVWGLIGLIILGGILALILIGPKGILQKYLPNDRGGLTVKEGQSAFEAIQAQPEDKQTCIKDTLGPDRYQAITKSGDLTDEEFEKIKQTCYGSG